MTELEDFKWDENEKVYELLEPGQYKMICIESEIKKTANEQGTYINLCFEVVDHDRAGKRVYDTMIIVYEGGKNPAATMAIGKAKLAQVTKALNMPVFSFKDTSQLHHKELLCDVEIDPNPGYKAKNVITAYSAIGKQMSSVESKVETGKPDKFEDVDNIPF